jgi:hypothetical protein
MGLDAAGDGLQGPLTRIAGEVENIPLENLRHADPVPHDVKVTGVLRVFICGDTAEKA